MSKKTENKNVAELTEAQKALIPQYYERFKAIGLNTDPTDKPKAEDAIRRAYAYMAKDPNSGYKINPEIVWAGSPKEGRLWAACYAKGSDIYSPEDIPVHGHKIVTQAEINAQKELASYGSFENYWVSMYVFIAEQGLVDDIDELPGIVLDIVTHCGAYWIFEDLVVMTPKPTAIHMLNDKLHCTTGPAIVYPNGDCRYAINGEAKNSLMEVMIALRNGDDTKEDGSGDSAA